MIEYGLINLINLFMPKASVLLIANGYIPLSEVSVCWPNFSIVFTEYGLIFPDSLLKLVTFSKDKIEKGLIFEKYVKNK